MIRTDLLSKLDYQIVARKDIIVRVLLEGFGGLYLDLCICIFVKNASMSVGSGGSLLMSVRGVIGNDLLDFPLWKLQMILLKNSYDCYSDN